MKNFVYLAFILIIILSSCTNNELSDAYGNFESTEIVISSEVSGKLLSFTVQEGDELNAGQVVGLIDTTQYYLQREQIIAQKMSIQSKIGNIFSQIAVLQEQKENALKDKKRIEFLLKDNAATQKEIDDINGRIAVIERQIESIESQNSTIVNEVKSLDARIAQANDLLSKCIIRNPENGTVLNKFVETNEIVSPGKPLYTIADLTRMTLKVYLSGEQLSNIKLGQKVKVLVDKGRKDNRILDGIINWIASKAEFTPKIIQTKEERVNSVYAVKISVKNDGLLKIGMPGEVLLSNNKINPKNK